MKLWIVLVLAACGGKKSEPTNSSGSAPPPSADSGSAPGPRETGPLPKRWAELGLATPESVLYDADADVYLVSNINGKPADADDNGFISRISPDGKVLALKWIDGAKPDVKLDAPKGMAISDGVLWVADITVVRKFDAKTGAPLGDVKIDGATFLNDVATAKDGGVYVTDTGMDASFKPSGTDAVYLIGKDGKVTALAKHKELGGPNGVTSIDGTVYIVTFRSGLIQTVPASNDKPWSLPKGQLDGIVAIGKDDFLVSSWEGKTVYRGAPFGGWKDLKLDTEAPADIGYDSKRKRLLVPEFNGNAIRVVDL